MAMNNSLAEVHPELITEWSEKNLPLTPDDITFGSNKKVWWKGTCGHEWQTSVKARSNGEKCPICSGARVIAGINDLATLEPLLAKQWSKKNKIKPTEVSIGSHKKVIWRCKKGHEWEAVVKSRTINKTGCPYCSHNKVLAGFNDLATLLPDIAAEWSDRNYPLLPTQVTVFANRKAWWKCKDCGREWNTLISTRSGGSKCPYCSGYIFSKGFNDLQTTHPEIASEWSEKNLPLKPDEVNAKSRKNVWWKCRKCGNEWKSVVNARVKGTVCPVCAEREVLAGYNDLATTDSQLLSEWDYEQNKLKPTEVSRTSAKRAWWKCRHGHSWSMKINERTILNKGCRICEQEYLSLFPALAVSYYSNKKGLKAELGSDRLLGVPLETYIPSEKLAIESGSADENIEIMKASGMNVWEGRQERFDLTELACYRELKDTKRLERSLGTLGGGNHFIEIDEAGDGTKYLVIHSGSRNLGKQVAELYQKLAINLDRGYGDYLEKRDEIIRTYKEQGRRSEIQDALKQLHWQVYESETSMPEDLCYLSGKYLEDYLHDVEICQAFARRSREKMAEIILERTGMAGREAFHTIHNYIDTDEMILRKGAIAAHSGEKVLIPINMRDGSVLAVGKGNPEWNYSAPHGAGRLMSRTKAKANLSMDEYRETMKGIYTTSINENTLDEAPMAYKSLEDIIDVIRESVDVIDVMKPIYNFKASD